METPPEAEAWIDEFQKLINKVNAGQARPGDLLAAQLSRLEGMARKRLNESFRRLRDQGVETGDIVQEAVSRFLQRIEGEGGLDRLQTVRDFFVMAANYLRWTLLDTANRIRQAGIRVALDTSEEFTFDPPYETKHPFDQDQMAAFHKAVESLPPDLKNVYDLVAFGELKYSEAAECLGVTRDVINHRYQEARARIQGELQS